MRCELAPAGWQCTLERHYFSPCRPRPAWWNVRGWLWQWKNRR